jgi:4-hydroxy-2-oxoheptanedioate aldolase
MRANKLRELLTSGAPSLSTRITTTWPTAVELLGHTGLYDYVEFLAEYGPFDLHDLDNLCRAAELYNMGSMVKVDQEPRGFLAQRGIGAGFQAVNFADCRSAAEVRDCVAIVRPETPEDGGRHGVGARRFALPGYGGSAEYVQYLREVVVMIMIEKHSAVEELEAILATPGVDMIQWGPSDYSMSVGKAGKSSSPEITQVEHRVFRMALDAGIPPRVEIATPDQARFYLDMGVRHFSLGTDVSILYQTWRKQGDELRRALEGH